MKKWQVDVLQESFKDVVEQVIEAQRISDKMFTDLEEKRLKLERERKTRKEHQEFQLRVMQMLRGFLGMQPFI